MKKLIHYSIALASLVVTSVSNAAPANDNFANATVLSTYYDQREGSTVAATKQAGESNANGSTIWYKLTSPNHPATLSYSLKVYGTASYDDHEIKVYQSTGNGGITELAEVDRLTVDGGEIKTDSVAVSGNTNYYLRVGTYYTDGAQMPVQVTIDVTPKDSWNPYYQSAYDYYVYFSSYGDYNSAVAYYSYLRGLGDYGYFLAFNKKPEAYFAFYQGQAIYNFYIMVNRGDSRAASYYYNYYFGLAYYYYFAFYNRNSEANTYYSYFINQANGAYR